MPSILKICVDAACDNNSKFRFMGIGVAVWVDGTRRYDLDKCYMYGTAGTNNVAEWEAFRKGLDTAREYISENPDTKFSIYGDSQIVINQFKGIWQIKNRDFDEYYLASHAIINSILDKNKRIGWIPREENTEADALSKKAIVDYLKTISQ